MLSEEKGKNSVDEVFNSERKVFLSISIASLWVCYGLVCFLFKVSIPIILGYLLAMSVVFGMILLKPFLGKKLPWLYAWLHEDK